MFIGHYRGLLTKPMAEITIGFKIVQNGVVYRGDIEGDKIEFKVVSQVFDPLRIEASPTFLKNVARALYLTRVEVADCKPNRIYVAKGVTNLKPMPETFPDGDFTHHIPTIAAIVNGFLAEQDGTNDNNYCRFVVLTAGFHELFEVYVDRTGVTITTF